eukprot:jgi/Antlo1/235/2193
METTDRIALCFPQCGNFLFWCIFSIIGQPACIWLHYRSLYFERLRRLACTVDQDGHCWGLNNFRSRVHGV